jgi:hypothetical protein
MYYPIVSEKKYLLSLYPNAKHIINVFDFLVNHGLLDFRPVPATGWKVVNSSTVDDMHGMLEECTFLPNKLLKVSGFAFNPFEDTVVILKYKDANGNLQPFSIIRLTEERKDVVRKLKKPTLLSSGFSKETEINDLPSEKLEISAWAYHRKTMTTSQLLSVTH